MKHLIKTLLLSMVMVPVLTNAQNEGVKASILTNNNQQLAGAIKDQLKNKGNIVFTGADGNKKVMNPSDLQSFSINGTNYISYASDFYREVVAGPKSTLYQRVTDNSGKMLYNGAEVVSVTTAEGKSGDYYLQTKLDSKMALVTKKNFDVVMLTACNDCPALVSDIKAKQVSFTELEKLVQRYNTCN